MSHEFETGFVVGQEAWHGLATVLKGHPTIEDAIKEAKLDWEVEKVRLEAVFTEKTVGDDGPEEVEHRLEVPSHMAMVRESDRSVLGVVATPYKPFQNADAFGWFAPLVDDGTVVLASAGSLQKGRKVWILGRYADDIEVIDGDKLAPFVLFAIGHDGKMSVRINNTEILVVCMNTARAALGETDDEGLAAGSKFKETEGGIAIPHVGDVKAKAEMARAAIVNMNRQLKITVREFQRLYQVPVSDQVVQEIARDLFDPDFHKAKRLVDKFRARLEHSEPAEPIREEVAAKIAELEGILNDPERFQRKTVKKVVDAFHNAPGAAIRGRTAWGAWNAVTYHIDHGKQSSADARLNSSWFGEGARQRQRAFEMVREVAR